MPVFTGDPERAPVDVLGDLGEIFAVFDARTQDSGNVSYGVAEPGGRRFFVKTAGSPDAAAHLGHADRVALLRNAVTVAAAVRHPAVPALFGTADSAHGPMLVGEWRTGELLHDADVRDRFRALPPERIRSALTAIVEVHRLAAAAGLVACDFYDGCLLYDFTAHRLSIMDLDNYRPPFRNEMGRMFGSSRFMAPEEFALGAAIDERTTVFTLGRTVFNLLGDGSAEPSAFRGTGAEHAVASRACTVAREGRYATVAAFAGAWAEAGPTG